MRMMLTHRGGQTVEGLLLAVNREQMRVVISGQADTIELCRVDGSWRTEDGQSFEIDAVTAVDGMDYSEMLSRLVPRTMGAGSSSAF